MVLYSVVSSVLWRFWLGGRKGIGLVKPRAKGSVPEEVDEEKWRGNWLSDINLKMAIKMEVVLVLYPVAFVYDMF